MVITSSLLAQIRFVFQPRPVVLLGMNGGLRRELELRREYLERREGILSSGKERTEGKQERG